MSLSTMANRILRYCPGIHPDVVKSTINDGYAQLSLMEWNRLNVTRSIYTYPPYSAGKVTIAGDGTVTGVGTAFTSLMVGSQLRAYYSDSFFAITKVDSPTALLVDGWPGLVVGTPIAYYIFTITYPTPIPMKVIFDVTYQTALEKKNQAFFNRRDPERSTTGSPTWWAYAGWKEGGYPLIEIYPVPDQVYPLRLYGKAGGNVLGDSDTPLLDEQLIENLSLLSCYRVKNGMDPKGGWDAKLKEQITFYSELLATARDEDYQLGSHREKVKDYMDTHDEYPSSDSFWASHDIE